LLAGVIAALGVSAVQLLVGDALLPRFVVFGTVLAMVPVHAALTWISLAGRNRGEDRDRVIVVAEPSEHDRIAIDVAFEPEQPVVVAAVLSHDEAMGDGSSAPLVDALVAYRATLVVLDHRALTCASIVTQAATLHESGVRIRSVHDFYEQWLAKLPRGELERTSLFFDISELHGRSQYTRMKRIADVVIAGLGVVVLAAVTPIVVVGDLVANRGPLLYRQTRVGKGGRHFTILKFRTMAAAAPEAGVTSGSSWTQTDDPRVTPFGRILRSTHLDELPQVLNILRGDLAVVGPRPEQPHYVEELTERLAFYDLRHLVRPGLTGWAQVKYGYAGDERDALEKLQYEFFYLRHQDLGLDARTIVRTLRSIVGGSGAGR
jgi:lipopolysaccharide/colanic/teichoic acid biosynthesis glycosyltransferase